MSVEEKELLQGAGVENYESVAELAKGYKSARTELSAISEKLKNKPDFDTMTTSEKSKTVFGDVGKSGLSGDAAQRVSQMSEKYGLPANVLDEVYGSFTGTAKIEPTKTKEVSEPLEDKSKIDAFLGEENNVAYLHKYLEDHKMNLEDFVFNASRGKVPLGKIKLYTEAGKRAFIEEGDEGVSITRSDVASITPDNASATLSAIRKENSRALYDKNHVNHKKVSRIYEAACKAIGIPGLID